MSATVRIELDSAGIAAFLKTDPGIGAMLRGKADAVAAAAGPGHRAEVWVGHDRQRATVRTTTFAAAKAEATDHTLLKALDAAR